MEEAEYWAGEVQGNSWQIGKVDCVQASQKLEAASVDLVIADPPYNLGVAYDTYHDKRPDDEYLTWVKSWLTQVHRVLKNTGSCFLFMGEQYASEVDVLAKQLGFIKRSRIVWYYTFGQSQKKNFTPSHVAIFYYVKSKKFTFNANDPSQKVPSARQLVYKDKRAVQGGKMPDNVWLLTRSQYEEVLGPDADIWLQSRVCGNFKERLSPDLPCQLPAAILQRIIGLASNPGDKVFDPFCGTGSTAVQAVKMGRHAVSFDISPLCTGYAVQQLRSLQ